MNADTAGGWHFDRAQRGAKGKRGDNKEWQLVDSRARTSQVSRSVFEAKNPCDIRSADAVGTARSQYSQLARRAIRDPAASFLPPPPPPSSPLTLEYLAFFPFFVFVFLLIFSTSEGR